MIYHMVCARKGCDQELMWMRDMRDPPGLCPQCGCKMWHVQSVEGSSHRFAPKRRVYRPRRSSSRRPSPRQHRLYPGALGMLDRLARKVRLFILGSRA